MTPIQLKGADVDSDLGRSLDRLIAHRIGEARSHLGSRVQSTARVAAASVDIAIPVHDAFEHFERCLASVRDHSEAHHRIVLIDDASADVRVWRLMQRVAADDPRVELRRNADNEGYLRTVNAAIKDSRRDLILLNSDTIVGPGWIDRLAAGAYSDPTVGIACPVSDNATLLTVVEPERIESFDAGSLARSVEAASSGGYPRLPTAVGFCMYLKRAALNALQDFDPAFDPGYGEEDDFSMRAWHQGWSIVACPDVLVRHAGGSSFGGSPQTRRRRELHARILRGRWPQFERVVREWWRDWPLREQSCRLRAGTEDDLPRVLHVLHRLRRLGGTELHTLSIAQSLSRRYRSTLIATEPLPGVWSEIAEMEAAHGVERWIVNESYVRPNQRIRGVAADLSDPGVERRFARMANGSGFDLVHFHSLLHWNSLLLPQLAASTGAAVVITAHSLESLCADYTLVPPHLGRACGKRFGGSDADCLPCLDPRIWRRPGAPVTDSRTYLRARHHFWQRALESAHVIVAPSEFVAERVRAAFGNSVGDLIAVVPHGIRAVAAPSAPPSDQTFTIGFLGGLAREKGAQTVIELARCPSLAHVRFEVHGCADPGELPADLPPNIAVFPAFAPDRLADVLERMHVVLLPSLGEETFSLLLSECRAACVPVIASRLGALPERVQHGVDGWLLPPHDQGAWRLLLETLAHSKGHEKLSNVRAALATLPTRAITENADDYAGLYELALERASRQPLPKSIGAPRARDIASESLERSARQLRHATWDDERELVALATRVATPRPLPSLTVLVCVARHNVDMLAATLDALRSWPGRHRFELLAVDDVALPTAADRVDATTRSSDPHATRKLARRITGSSKDWFVCIDAGDALSARAATWLSEVVQSKCDAFIGGFDHVNRSGEHYAPAVQATPQTILSMGGAHAPQGLFVRGKQLRGAIDDWMDAHAWGYAILLSLIRRGTRIRDVGQVLVHRSDRNASPSQRESVLQAHRAVANEHRAVLGIKGHCLLNDSGFGWKFRPASCNRAVAVRIFGAATHAAAQFALGSIRESCGQAGVDLGIHDPDAAWPKVDRLVLIRSDVRPESATWLADLLGWLEFDHVAAVAPRRIGPMGAPQPCGYEFNGTRVRDVDDPRSTRGFDVGGATDFARSLPALATACIAIATDRTGTRELADLLDVGMVSARSFVAQQALRARGLLLWTPDVSVIQQHADVSMRAQVQASPANGAVRDPMQRLRAGLATGPPLSWRRRPLRGSAGERCALPRVAALTRDYWASSRLRVSQPLRDLVAQGSIDTPAIWRARLERLPSLAELAQHRPDTLLVHHCFDDASLALLEACASHLPNVRRVVLVDDLISEVPDYSPAAESIPQDIESRLRRALGLADLLVTTSAALAERYGDWASQCSVIENALSNEWFDLPRIKRDRSPRQPLRVGWAGAQQHAGDLALIEEVVRARRTLQWVFMGMAPNSATHANAELHPMVDFDRYPHQLAALELDIALVPLADNAFNCCKSALKLMELGALGVPVIASDLRPYADAPVQRVGAELASWLDALDEWTASETERARAGENLRQWAEAHHRQSQRRSMWLEALTGGRPHA